MIIDSFLLILTHPDLRYAPATPLEGICPGCATLKGDPIRLLTLSPEVDPLWSGRNPRRFAALGNAYQDLPCTHKSNSAETGR